MRVMTQAQRQPMTQEKPYVTIYCDGASLPKNGEHGGYGAVLVFDYQENGELKTAKKEISGYLGNRVTNNAAEVYAMAYALKALTKSCKVALISDSQYAINGAIGAWARDKNADAFDFLDVEKSIHDVSFQWQSEKRTKVSDHTRAHQLAELAARGKGK